MCARAVRGRRRREFAAHGVRCDHVVVCVAGWPLSRWSSVAIASVGRVGDEQVDVVGFSVAFDQLDVEFGADHAHGGFAVGEHRVGDHTAPVFWL